VLHLIVMFWFSRQYLPSDCLERLLRMPISVEEIISSKTMSKSASVYSFESI